MRTRRIQCDPLGEELENLILVLLEKPSLSGDMWFDLLDVRLENLGCKGCHKGLCERTIFFLQRLGSCDGLPNLGKELAPHSTAA
jgi:hypothetical protein